MNCLRAGVAVHYKQRPEWGTGVIQRVTRTNRLLVRFVNAHPMYEGEFHSAELEEIARVHA